MSNAKHDQNGIPTLIAVEQTDGVTIVCIAANPANNSLKVGDGTTGTDYGPIDAPHDENHVPCFLATSSVDGVTPVVVYGSLDGELMIDSQ